ncbi:hypothetical protein [Streptomyces microflavus]|uniref:hypothetical protein n=1 Tax=Streptomyces microflavus TaxID=1919 RepID=UPI0036A349B7
MDLEDAVAPEAREHARDVCAAWLQGIAPAADRPDGPEIWGRVNPGARGRAGARAAASPALTGLVVAKTERVGDLVAVAAELEEAPWISLCPLSGERGGPALGAIHRAWPAGGAPSTG